MADAPDLFEAISTQRALRYSVLTTRPRRGFENEIKEKLGIPENVDTAALLPLGYPAPQNRYGPTNRRPVEDVTFDERWGRRWEARP